MKISFYPEQELRRRTLAWAVKLRVNPKSIRIKKMANKWGTCSSSGIITLADDLVGKEKKFQDFVIVHELLHLRLANHGKVFNALMNAHVPYWRQLDLDESISPHTSNKICEGQSRYFATTGLRANRYGCR